MDAALVPVVADMSSLAGQITDLSGEVAGRLSDASLVGAAIERMFGTPKPLDSRFTKLRTGMYATGLVKVAVLGSSTIAGGITDYPEQAIVPRLAYRSGASSVESLDSVAGPISTGGVRWFQGAVGGTTSANFYPTARRTALNHLKPDYVVIAVGSNDYGTGVTPAAYKTNLRSALQHITTSSPGVVLVLVHQQARLDVTSPPNPWSSFGTALSEIAVEFNAIFVDMDLATRAGRLSSANTWGFVGNDGIHMDTVGQRFFADLLGEVMGIPNESGYVRTDESRPFTLPASKDFTNGENYPIGRTYRTTNYPRIFRLHGAIFTRSSAAGLKELNVTLTGGKNTPVVAARLISDTSEKSQTIDMQWFVPPGVAPTLGAHVSIVGGGTVYISGSSAYSWLSMEISPA